MKLIVKSENTSVDYGFCVWLLSVIKNEYRVKVKPQKYSRIDSYLKTLDFMENHKGVTSDTIIRMGLDNLVVHTSNNSFIIEVNNTIWFDFDNRIKLSSMCNLINFGTVSISGYPIIVNLFNDVSNHMNALLFHYTNVMKR